MAKAAPKKLTKCAPGTIETAANDERAHAGGSRERLFILARSASIATHRQPSSRSTRRRLQRARSRQTRRMRSPFATA